MPRTTFARPTPPDAVPLSALAHRAKAFWAIRLNGWPSWSEELTLTPEYLRAHEGFVATSNDEIVGVSHAGAEAPGSSSRTCGSRRRHHRRGIG